MNIEYFYIIKHIKSNKLYVGCQYSRKANPDLLLKAGGYYTSSNTVKKIIKEEGLSSFTIETIITDFDETELRSYAEGNNLPEYLNLSHIFESKYLLENDCAKNPLYLNKSNNTRNSVHFGIKKIKEDYKEKTGFINPSQVPQIKEKKKQTALKNFGTEFFLQSNEGKEKIKNTNLEKYGVENVFQNEEIKLKIKEDLKTKHGVEHNSQRPEVKEKIKKAITGLKRSEETCKKLSDLNKDHVIVLNSKTGKKERVSKDVYENNKDLYVGSTKGFVNVRDKDNKIFMVSKEDPRYISGELIHMSIGIKKYLDPETNEIHYVHFSTAKEKGYVPFAKSQKNTYKHNHIELEEHI